MSNWCDWLNLAFTTDHTSWDNHNHVVWYGQDYDNY